MAVGEIQVGETVVLQRYNYMRTHVLNPNKESVHSCLFGSCFGSLLPNSARKIYIFI
jgi:hypothetical protein